MATIVYEGNVIDLASVPNHIGIIMDGNGRWATQRGLSRSQGHRVGVGRIQDLLRFALKYHINEISLYTFSTENWSRPAKEVNYLFKLVRLFFEKNIQKLIKKDICVRIIGFDNDLPEEVKNVLKHTSEATKNCKKLYLNLCFNYGGRQDFLTATQNIAKRVSEGLLKYQDINQQVLHDALLSAQASDIDLLIRTSNEYRVSNFLPWQISYAEFLFIETHWPDFSELDFVQALMSYSKRTRRFGGIKT